MIKVILQAILVSALFLSLSLKDIHVPLLQAKLSVCQYGTEWAQQACCFETEILKAHSSGAAVLVSMGSPETETILAKISIFSHRIKAAERRR